jgi:hypothetical protein
LISLRDIEVRSPKPTRVLCAKPIILKSPCRSSGGGLKTRRRPREYAPGISPSGGPMNCCMPRSSPFNRNSGPSAFSGPIARFIQSVGRCCGNEPRPGAPRTISDEQVEQVVVRTLESTPRGATHWSTREMAKATGHSHMTISRIAANPRRKLTRCARGAPAPVPSEIGEPARSIRVSRLHSISVWPWVVPCACSLLIEQYARTALFNGDKCYAGINRGS